MRKKLALLAIMITLTVVFCGCAVLNITCSIDEENTAKMLIDLHISTMDMSKEEASNAFSATGKIVHHLRLQGYDADYEKSDDKIIFTASKSKGCEDTESALDALIEFMADDASPFAQVDGGYSPSFFSDIYNLQAVLDLSNIISDEFLESLTPSNKYVIDNALKNTEGMVTFDLWGETAEYTGSLEGSQNSMPISFDEPVTLSRAIRLYNAENIKEHEVLSENLNMLDAEKQKLKTAQQIAISAVFLIILIMLAIIISRKSKK